MSLTARISRRLALLAEGGHDADPVPQSAATRLQFGVVASRAEFHSVARLVGRMYALEGYLPAGEGPGRPYYRLHQFLPDARVLVARLEGQVLGTLTLVPDSPAGLPLDDLYGREAAALRNQGRRLSELCSLAVSPACRGLGSRVLMGLLRLATLYLVGHTQTSDALIVLKPSHRGFYESRLGFQLLGGCRPDDRFAGTEAILLRIKRETFTSATQSRRHDGLPGSSWKSLYAPPTNEEQALLAQARAPKAWLRQLAQEIVAARSGFREDPHAELRARLPQILADSEGAPRTTSCRGSASHGKTAQSTTVPVQASGPEAQPLQEA